MRTLWARLRALFDERAEPGRHERVEPATIALRGRDHAVRLANLSPAGAMIEFDGEAAVGDAVVLRLLDRSEKAGQVRWVRDGRMGINFAGSGPMPTARE